MSGSTLPKSVQAQMGASGDDSSSSSSQDRVKRYRDFIEKYRNLPDDFLRIPSSYFPQEQALLPHAGPFMARETPLVDMIHISVVEAQLLKNYGLLRMDLYCKIRVGHMVCETQTCLNGAKNPKWDGVYQFALKPGIDSFHIEIYDEKQFSLDDKIAWLHEPIPPEVFQGITVERWFPLSGRLGPGKEGSILLVLSHKRVPMRSAQGQPPIGAHHNPAGPPPLTVFVPAVNQGGGTIIAGPPPSGMPAQPIGVAHHHHHMAQPASQQIIGGGELPPVPTTDATVTTPDTPAAPVSEEDVNQLSEMFPSIDKAIIRAILQNNHNDKESSIGALLALG